MGVEFDFKSHLNRTKLTTTPYDQPVNELDLLTESTEGTDLQALLNILNLVQERLRDRFEDAEQLISLIIEMNEDRRLFITFLRRQHQQQSPILRRSVPIIQRPPVPIQQLWRERQERQQAQMNRNFERRRTLSIIEPIISEIDADVSQNIMRILQRQEFPRNRPISTQSESIQMELNQQEFFDDFVHSQSLRSMPNLAIQGYDIGNFPQIFINQREREDYRQGQPNQNQRLQEEMRKQHRQQVIPQNDETTNHIDLNQNSQMRIKPNIKRQQEIIDEPVTCWQFLSRMVSNFFRKFR